MVTENAVAAVGMKTGKMTPKDFGDKACQKLETANQENRDEVISKLEAKKTAKTITVEQDKVLGLAKTVGMTFSSVVSTIPNAAGSWSGCSNGVAREQIPSKLVDGGTGPQKGGLSKAIRMSDDEEHDDAKHDAGVLCDRGHVYWGGGYGGHAEPKIISHLTNLVGPENMRGGSLLFNIDWRSGRYGNSGMPCGHCHEALCRAMRECDIQIFICCEPEKQPTELSEDDCSGEDGYTNLCMRVDKNTRPGRKSK